MAKKKKSAWTPERRKEASDRAKARMAASPQTNTPETKVEQPNLPPVNQQPVAGTPGTITLTDDQFKTLVDRLTNGQTSDKAPAPSLTAGVGMQTNPWGQVVGTITKFNTDPDYYPNPIENLLTEFDQDRRMRRFNLRENYFITWDITAKPYETRDNLNVAEPTFHITLYMNMFDDQGEDTDKAIVVQTLHMNEDTELCMNFASENSIQVDTEGLRELMDRTRYARIRNWLLDIFFPPRNFQLNVQDEEQAIGGQVVKVITKSNVKGFGNPAPKIADEELQ